MDVHLGFPVYTLTLCKQVRKTYIKYKTNIFLQENNYSYILSLFQMNDSTGQRTFVCGHIGHCHDDHEICYACRWNTLGFQCSTERGCRECEHWESSWVKDVLPRRPSSSIPKNASSLSSDSTRRHRDKKSSNTPIVSKTGDTMAGNISYKFTTSTIQYMYQYRPVEAVFIYESR